MNFLGALAFLAVLHIYSADKSKCGLEEFDCGVRGGCISRSLVCDGLPQCEGGQDEGNCEKTTEGSALRKIRRSEDGHEEIPERHYGLSARHKETPDSQKGSSDKHNEHNGSSDKRQGSSDKHKDSSEKHKGSSEKTNEESSKKGKDSGDKHSGEITRPTTRRTTARPRPTASKYTTERPTSTTKTSSTPQATQPLSTIILSTMGRQSTKPVTFTTSNITLTTTIKDSSAFRTTTHTYEKSDSTPVHPKDKESIISYGPSSTVTETNFQNITDDSLQNLPSNSVPESITVTTTTSFEKQATASSTTPSIPIPITSYAEATDSSFLADNTSNFSGTEFSKSSETQSLTFNPNSEKTDQALKPDSLTTILVSTSDPDSGLVSSFSVTTTQVSPSTKPKTDVIVPLPNTTISELVKPNELSTPTTPLPITTSPISATTTGGSSSTNSNLLASTTTSGTATSNPDPSVAATTTSPMSITTVPNFETVFTSPVTLVPTNPITSITTPSSNSGAALTNSVPVKITSTSERSSSASMMTTSSSGTTTPRSPSTHSSPNEINFTNSLSTDDISQSTTGETSGSTVATKTVSPPLTTAEEGSTTRRKLPSTTPTGSYSRDICENMYPSARIVTVSESSCGITCHWKRRHGCDWITFSKHIDKEDGIRCGHFKQCFKGKCKRRQSKKSCTGYY